MTKSVIFNHNEILQCIKNNYEKEDYELKENLEDIPEIKEMFQKERGLTIDPRVPIDLICVKRNKQKESKIELCHIIIVSSIEDIETKVKKNIEKRLLFYRFYLSRIISSRALKISMVIPYYGKGLNKNYFKKNGFGLIKLKSSKEIEIQYEPKSLRDLMIEDFEKTAFSPAIDEPKIMEKSEEIALFFDKYPHDAVNAIAGITHEQFGKKYIDRLLLDKMLKLKNIEYRKDLIEMINGHLTEKGDDYQFVAEVFDELWKKFIGVDYIKFLEIFEPALLNIFAETGERGERIYRDHYIHQFQVFMLGLYIMDKLYNKFTKKYKKPELSWLIISSFHDMAYPIEKYEEWTKDFFKSILKVSKPLANLELKTEFIDQSFLSCMGYIITQFCSAHQGEILGENWFAEKEGLIKIFYKQIVEAKKHCILSSISLLKTIQSKGDHVEEIEKTIKIDGRKSKFQEILKNVFLPSMLTICLHDSDIWKDLQKANLLPKLKFDCDSLSFLLIFCDSIQVFGRPSKSKIRDKKFREKKFFLDKYEYNLQKGFDLTIRSPSLIKDNTFFKKEVRELKNAESFLQRPQGIKFNVHLIDKNNESQDFEIKEN